MEWLDGYLEKLHSTREDSYKRLDILMMFNALMKRYILKKGAME